MSIMTSQIDLRPMKRDEIALIWTIDRQETITGFYKVVAGELRLQPEPFQAEGWHPSEPAHYTPILQGCFDRGGAFVGAFDGARLAGVAVLETDFIGQPPDQLQFYFLHVSHAYRGLGLGARLFDAIAEQARQRGARRLYVSATPSENTVRFYLARGCTVLLKPDPALFAAEPEDIHLEYKL